MGCRAVRPNGYFLFIVQLGHAEWPSLLCCSMRDVQRVLSGPAEWPFFFFGFNVDVQWLSGSQAEWSSSYVVQCLMFSGCRVVTEEKFDGQCFDAESVSLIVVLLVICLILTCVYFA